MLYDKLHQREGFKRELRINPSSRYPRKLTPREGFGEGDCWRQCANCVVVGMFEDLPTVPHTPDEREAAIEGASLFWPASRSSVKCILTAR